MARAKQPLTAVIISVQGGKGYFTPVDADGVEAKRSKGYPPHADIEVSIAQMFETEPKKVADEQAERARYRSCLDEAFRAARQAYPDLDAERFRIAEGQDPSLLA